MTKVSFFVLLALTAADLGVPPDAAQSTNYHPAPPAQTEDSSDRQLYFDPLGRQLARTKQTARKQRELVYDPLGRQLARTKQTARKQRELAVGPPPPRPPHRRRR